MKKTLITLAAAAAMATPAMAVEFQPTEDVKLNLYGQVYMDFFYNYSESHNGGSVSTAGNGFTIAQGTTGNSEGIHSFGSEGFFSSRLGLDVNYKNIIGGTIEFGAKPSEIVRRAFMQVYFGGETDHSLLIGKDTSIAAYSFGQVSRDGGALNNYGTLADNRRLQLRYDYKGFQLAVILPVDLGKVDGNVADTGSTIKKITKDNYEVKNFDTIPRLELAYTLGMENGSEFKAFAGYAAYVYQLQSGLNEDNTAKEGYSATPAGLLGKRTAQHAFNIGIGGTQNFGNSFLNYTAWFGQNLHLTDSHSPTSDPRFFLGSKFHDINTNEYDINEARYEVYSAGGAIGFGHTFAEKYTLQAGVGYSASFGPGYKTQDDRLGAYLNTVIKVNDWYSIIPEIAYLDELIGSQISGKGNQKQGYTFIAGVMNVFEF